ncbi:hypothetical protein HHK36_017545 [Tetracentron sinense]|uniref:RING-type E3 ubiquitin transferase n=1 Tax=Tetracentron sinense TaxID=13715 RepID=A0A835DFT8_TETSI|nr:hypothetical protein HHK36_017545 [Tetracentron sinense]
MEVNAEKTTITDASIKMEDGVLKWIHFRYKNLTRFCLKCGRIGHGLRSETEKLGSCTASSPLEQNHSLHADAAEGEKWGSKDVKLSKFIELLMIVAFLDLGFEGHKHGIGDDGGSTSAAEASQLKSCISKSFQVNNESVVRVTEKPNRSLPKVSHMQDERALLSPSKSVVYRNGVVQSVLAILFQDQRGMGEAQVARYWCYMCSQMVNPVMEVEIKCPFCESGCVEEMDSIRDQDNQTDLGSDRALSLWAPILLGMMGGPRRRSFRRENDDDVDDTQHRETEPVRDLESTFRTSRRSSANILHLLQNLHAGMTPESENHESDGEREHVILINPFNQAIILQGSFNLNQAQNQSQNTPGSRGDFTRPGLDLLLQHLAENDPNRYGTPPAQKEAVEAMLTVKVGENLQCSVCLEDFEIRGEAKEMPCKHKFHSECILPWLELHSSCPVCRFQMPANESKLESDGSGNSNNRVESTEGHGSGGEERNGNGRRFRIPWPFRGLFSMSGSPSARNSSSASSGSAPGSASHRDEN